ncbi:hypothetical protein [Micromonospora sp. NPDC005197]|uniref:hypothetical protein n=1 Tax=unclassified Micromonospora TaxID=2617518 RepID=UPI0033A35C25
MTAERVEVPPRLDRQRRFTVVAVCCVVLATLVASAPGGAVVSLVLFVLAARRQAPRALRWSLGVSSAVLAALSLLVLADAGFGFTALA